MQRVVSMEIACPLLAATAGLLALWWAAIPSRRFVTAAVADSHAVQIKQSFVPVKT
jgi:hypothetical protein